MRELTLSRVASLVGGKLYPAEAGYTVINGVSIDSRKIKPGDIFIALRGNRFDGQSFVSDAATRGAGCVIVENLPQEELPLPFILVDDSLKALGDLSAFVRRSCRASLIGITGSFGKSTTKELIGRVLKRSYRTVVAEKSFNNLIGLPLTLLRVVPETEFIVAEMGINQRGEMERLIEIASPNYAVITAIAPVHTEGLGDLSGVAQEKLRLLYCLPPGAVAFLNGDDMTLRKLSQTPFCEVVYYGFGEGVDLRGEVVDWGWDGVRFRIEGREFMLPLLGKFWVYSALAAYAVGRRFSVPTDIMDEVFSTFSPMPGRMVTHKVRGVVVVDDSYNASPVSMKEVLRTVSSLPARRRFAFLADMLELGDQAEQAHRDLGAYLATLPFNSVSFVGNLSAFAYQEAKLKGLTSAKHYEKIDELLVSMDKLGLEEGDVVVVKGSRAMGMEKVVEKLLEVI